MASWFFIINVLLLLSSTHLQARFRAHSKRRYAISAQSFLPSFPPSNNNLHVDAGERHETNDEQSWVETMKDLTSTTSTPSQYQASDEQVQQFTRLLIDRLNLKEAPNVTVNANDDIGLPESILKQLGEHQAATDSAENNYYRQQKIQDEVQPTAERAILPGDYISNHTCQHQLSSKLNLDDNDVKNIDCFRFTKESKSLPTNQVINELRLYVKRNYFNLHEQHKKLTPDMFQVYQVFRPTSNNTVHNPPPGLTGTTRLSINEVKELNDNWFELTLEPNNEGTNIQQLYKQLIMPWYGLAIDRDLQLSSSTPRSLQSSNRYYYRQYHTKKHDTFSKRSDNEDQNNKESQQQLPYMLVEYGDKLFPSSSGRRGTRDATARPARGCNPTSPCCRRALTIDLDQGSNALNFVIYPRQLDIGECVGLCGISGSSLKHTDVKNAQFRNEQNSAYNLFLLQNNLHSNRSTTTTQINRIDQHSPQCCSYSRTGGLELMYTTMNGGPIIRKFIPNMVVEECKCGLPATIQQV
ncbi:unnamed protein product [Adineta steineri]|uniref:TGF-beta family profile domain-containing protein n=1 Tax=Adineta steineri TaxID=433720 RepID=A0A818MJ59_9BILA|nr:unnamed protein product [Adineta steineri]CAF3590145.1 unnamed protein product [Adineta steineri]